MSEGNPLFNNPDTSGQSDVDVQWTQIRFGVNPKYKVTDKDGNVTYPVVMTYDERNENGQLREDQVLTVGNGFKVDDDGNLTAENPKLNQGGAADGFARNSKGAKLLDSLVPLNIDAFRAKLEAGIGPRNPEFWEGISFHLVLDKEYGKPDAEGKRKEFPFPTATAFYGWDGIPAEGSVDDPNTAVVGSEGAQLVANLNESQPEVYAALRDLAKGKSYVDFVTEAYSLEAIADERVQNVVDNEDAFKVLKNA